MFLRNAEEYRVSWTSVSVEIFIACLFSFPFGTGPRAFGLVFLILSENGTSKIRLDSARVSSLSGIIVGAAVYIGILLILFFSNFGK